MRGRAGVCVGGGLGVVAKYPKGEGVGEARSQEARRMSRIEKRVLFIPLLYLMSARLLK